MRIFRSAEILAASAVLLFIGLVPGTARGLQELVSTGQGTRKTDLTVYNNNLALVRQTRSVPVAEGLFELRFTDVAGKIKPSSVMLGRTSRLALLEQRFDYDLLSVDRLLEHYIGQTVTLERENKVTGKVEQVSGLLLSLSGGRVLKIGERIEVDPEGRFILPGVPENLVIRPTLAWLMRGKGGGETDLEVSYLTEGLSWHCDYVLTLGWEPGRNELSGWAVVENRSGASFKDCSLSLVAGDLHRVREETAVDLSRSQGAGPRLMAAAPMEQFREEPLFEYHRYSLERPVTLDNNQNKQIGLLEVTGLKIDKQYRIYGRPDLFYSPMPQPRREMSAALYLEWDNSGNNYPGMPLPSGLVRIYQKNPAGEVYFLGEDRTGHTPKGARVSLAAGNAFEVTAVRKQTDFQKLSDRIRRTGFEIEITNGRNEPVNVQVIETLPGDWEMLENSLPYEKLEANTVRFSPRVPAESKTTLTYRIQFK